MSLRLSLLALFISLSPGCSCSGNGHVDPLPFTAQPGDTAVTCNCNLSFDYSRCSGGNCAAHFSMKLCLPPHLNVELTDTSTDAGVALANLSPAEFKAAVDEYCREEVSNIAYHLIKVFNGNWCDYKAPYAPGGGVGASVQCFAYPGEGRGGVATERDTTVCDKPCPTTVCDYASNCGDGVQDTWGNIDINACRCNQVTIYGCPGDPPQSLPTPVFCRPLDGEG